MIRTYEFYKKNFEMEFFEVDEVLRILSDVEKGNIVPSDIRSLGEKGLKVCLAECKYDLFKKLVKPFKVVENGEEAYKYLLDPVSLEVVKFIKSCPSSIMEQYGRMNMYEREVAEGNRTTFYPVTDIQAAKEGIILYPALKEDLLNAVYAIDIETIMKIKIKDVLAKQVCGLSWPIQSVRDVINYAELPLLYPMLDLFFKNIATISNDTGGCFEDGESECENFESNIIIDYDALDEANKTIADELVLSGDAVYCEKTLFIRKNNIILSVPCKRDETVYDVTSRMMKLVSKFQEQDMLYGIYDINEIIEYIDSVKYFCSDEDIRVISEILSEGYTSQNIIDVLKLVESFGGFEYYYDSEEDKFWVSEYYYRKHREYLEQKKFGIKGLK